MIGLAIEPGPRGVGLEVVVPSGLEALYRSSLLFQEPPTHLKHQQATTVMEKELKNVAGKQGIVQLFA